MIDLTIVQIGISLAASCIAPIAAKWIDMQIEIKLQNAEKRLQPMFQELIAHNRESDVIHKDLDRRVAAVESGHQSISDRLDNMARDLRAYRESNEGRVH